MVQLNKQEVEQSLKRGARSSQANSSAKKKIAAGAGDTHGIEECCLIMQGWSEVSQRPSEMNMGSDVKGDW